MSSGVKKVYPSMKTRTKNCSQLTGTLTKRKISEAHTQQTSNMKPTLQTR